LKNIPTKIYLQIPDDVEPEVDFNDVLKSLGTDLTWCQDKINENDIEYHLATSDRTVNLILKRIDFDIGRCNQRLEEDGHDPSWYKEEMAAKSTLINLRDYISRADV
jgi:hypothetical protein